MKHSYAQQMHRDENPQAYRPTILGLPLDTHWATSKVSKMSIFSSLGWHLGHAKLLRCLRTRHAARLTVRQRFLLDPTNHNPRVAFLVTTRAYSSCDGAEVGTVFLGVQLVGGGVAGMASGDPPQCLRIGDVFLLRLEDNYGFVTANPGLTPQARHSAADGRLLSR